jgi:hypothetical protein
MVVGVCNRSSYGLVMFVQLPFPGKYQSGATAPRCPRPLVAVAGRQRPRPLSMVVLFVVRVRSRRQCTSQRRSVYVSVEKSITHNRGVRVDLLKTLQLPYYYRCVLYGLPRKSKCTCIVFE